MTIEAPSYREYRTYINSALQAHSKLTVRQETDPSLDVEKLFSDNKQLPALLSFDWQIVYGRRGTGKTTLLSILSKDIDANDRRASLMISMAQCMVDLPSDTPPSTVGLVYFEKFIIEIGRFLYRIYQNKRASKNKDRKITKLLNSFLHRQPLVEQCILDIIGFAHRGEVFGALREKKSTVDELDSKKGSSPHISNVGGASGL